MKRPERGDQAQVSLYIYVYGKMWNETHTIFFSCLININIFLWLHIMSIYLAQSTT